MRTHSRYVLIVLGLTLVAARRGPVAQITYRTQEPVIIRASSMPRFSGKTVDWIRLYKWSGSWQEIPSQIDEFTPEHLKNYSTQGCIVDADPCETAVRLQGAVGDGFDGRDELVFMGRDAQGSTASTSNWVGTPGVSTENVRYRITVRDAVKGQVGYIYAYVWKQEPSFLNSVDDYADWIQDDSDRKSTRLNSSH